MNASSFIFQEAIAIAALNYNKKPIERHTEGNRIIYICPKCKQVWTQKNRMHKGLCTNCGQALDWSGTDDICVAWLICQNMEEAYYTVKKYEEIVGTLYGFDLEYWRQHVYRSWPKTLYFPFLKKTDYGRFMRWVAKDGPPRLVI